MATNGPPPTSLAVAANQFWQGVRDEIVNGGRATPGRESSTTRYRVLAVNIPLVGHGIATDAEVELGLIHSMGVSFNCRVTGYQIFAFTPGTVQVEITHTTPVTFPTEVSMTGGAFPSLLAAYFNEFYDLSTWPVTELEDGDQMHFYIASFADARDATLVLRLQDLDERVR